MKRDVYLQVIKVSENLFNRFGISKTAVDDIASKSSVSRATLFNNFGSKEGLIRAVLDENLKSMADIIERKSAAKSRFFESLRELIIARLNLINKLKFIVDKEISTELPVINEFRRKLNIVFRKGLVSFFDRGRLRDEEKRRLIEGLMIMISGIENKISADGVDFNSETVSSDIDFYIRSFIGNTSFREVLE